MNKAIKYSMVISTLMFTALPALAGQQQGEKPRQCLPMSQIDHIEVVDNNALIFHMHGKKKYINRLPYRCSGLKRNSFMHEATLNQYCDLDTITVLDTSIGMRLGSCPLGKFQPYVETESNED